MVKRVAIIILNWNGEKLLREFLPSVVKNTNADLGRVVVVDNHSTDGSWRCLEQEFPDVERVLFEENFGFAGGYNRAIEMIEAEYVVLLNSGGRSRLVGTVGRRVGPGREGCGRAAEDISISG